MSLAMSLRLTLGAIDTNAWTCGTPIIALLFVVVVDGGCFGVKKADLEDNGMKTSLVGGKN